MTTPTVSIYDLTKDIAVDGVNQMIAKRQGLAIPRVTDGLKPRRAPVREGLHVFTPEELLALVIHPVQVNGRVIGYQRELDVPHARRVARKLSDGTPLPLIHVALDGKGRMAIVDGQHRAVAAVMARVPIEGVVKRMNKAEQAELFFSQRNAKAVDRNVLVLAGTGPFDRYVQEAVATTSHPWHGLVSASRSSKTKVAPYAMYQLLIRYVGNSEGQGASHKSAMDDRWDRGLADELAPLIACFGNKQTNPPMFRPFTLQAIGATAMWVFRRHQRHPEDIDRWTSHMPRFPVENYMYIRTQLDMTRVLLEHWNKRLSSARKVNR